MKHTKSIPINRSDTTSRDGVAMVEAVFILGMLLLILLGMLDLGMGVLQSNTVAEAARLLAREASVHGELAPPERAAWGPAPYSGHAGDGTEYAALVRGLFVTCDPEEVRIELEWVQGDNRLDHLVRVTVSVSHDPIIPWIKLSGPYSLTSTSVMRIEH